MEKLPIRNSHSLILGRVILFIVIILLCIFSSAEEEDKKWKTINNEILSIYRQTGDTGLLSWIKQNQNSIEPGMIDQFMQRAEQLGSEELVNISILLVQHNSDKRFTGIIYLMAGNFYFTRNHFSNAIKWYRRCLPLVEQEVDHGGIGGVCYLYGYSLHKLGDPMALEMSRKALRCFKNENDVEWQCQANILIAFILAKQGENSKALSILENTARISEKMGHVQITTDAWLNKALVYLTTGLVPQAIQINQKVLAYSQKNQYNWGQVKASSALARNYFFTGKLSSALDKYSQALTLFNRDKNQPIQHYEDKADIYQGMGDAHLYKGNIRMAFMMYQDAIDTLDKARLFSQKSDAYQGQGYIYAISGHSKRAMDMYQKALELYVKQNDPRGEAGVYLAMALLYTDMGELQQAHQMYRKSISILSDVDSPAGLGWALLGRARIFFNQKMWSSAIELANKALVQFQRLGYPQAYGHTYEFLGDINLTRKRWKPALEMYKKALFVYTDSRDIESSASAELKIGSALLMTGKHSRALENFDRSFAHFETYRKLAAFSHIQTSIIEEASPRFELVFRVLVQMGYSKRAFRYGELFRARRFLDQLGEGTVKLEKGISRIRIDQRDDLLARLSALVKQINQARRNKNKDLMDKLKSEYRKIEKKYEDLLLHIRLNNPLYASVKYPKTVTIPQVQNLLKEREGMLRYFIFKDEICLFFISNHHFQVVRLKINETQMNELVNRYLQAIKRRDSEAIGQHGRALYNSLFKPIEPLLKYVKTFFIVPDGNLALVPFESFRCDQGGDSLSRPTYLLERYAIKYIQSASVLNTLRKHHKKKPGNNTGQFIGFGDPVYNSGIAPLKAGGLEVQAISALFKKNNHFNIARLGSEAGEANAKAAHLKYFDYIHFACHGILGDRYQGLVLSQLPETNEDGYFTINEIMNCDYNAQLVVLSACKTAKGKMARAEGVTGLTRAVMYAGTPAVVASLWDVDDRGTKELMVKFYRNILERSMSKEAALRKAKTDLLNTPRYASPYFWSAFVMYGE